MQGNMQGNMQQQGMHGPMQQNMQNMQGPGGMQQNMQNMQNMQGGMQRGPRPQNPNQMNQMNQNRMPMQPGQQQNPRGPMSQQQQQNPQQRKLRYFLALFDYDPITMSPNPDSCEEELPFREGDTIKVRLIQHKLAISIISHMYFVCFRYTVIKTLMASIGEN